AVGISHLVCRDKLGKRRESASVSVVQRAAGDRQRGRGGRADAVDGEQSARQPQLHRATKPRPVAGELVQLDKFYFDARRSSDKFLQHFDQPGRTFASSVLACFHAVRSERVQLSSLLKNVPFAA